MGLAATAAKSGTGRVRDPEATRERLLECAAEEMHENGYAGASLDQILNKAGVTKGALYHHFGSKADLAVAVIDEVIRPFMVEEWLEPLRDSDDPISAFIEAAQHNFQHHGKRYVEWGCPLNNLIQELSNSDELFRAHVNAVVEELSSGIAEALERGQRAGSVRADIDPAGIGSFVVSSIEGLASLLKSSRDVSLVRSAAEVFLQFVGSLRPVGSPPTS